MNRIGRRPVVGLALAAVLAVLAGCGSSGAASGGSSAVTLTLGDQVKGLQTLLEAAGALNGTPYAVKWAQFQGAAPLFEAVKGGSVDTAVAGDLPTLQAAGGGVPVKAIAAQHSNGKGATILAQSDSPVRSVADLRGKEVVVSSARGSIAEYLLATALKAAGLSYSDVHVRYLLPTDAQAAFSSHKIELWATFGIYGLIAKGQGARELVDGGAGRTSGIGLLSASTKALADPAKRQAISDFVGRLARAVEWSKSHPEEYVKAYVDSSRVSPDIAKVLIAQGTQNLGPLSPDVQQTMQQVADTMQQIGSLPNHVDVAAITDTGVYPTS